MNFRKTAFIQFLFLIASLPNTASVWAKAVPSTDINVTLLGRPCILEGPLDEPTLRTIHSIGPAQIYPNFIPPFRNSNTDLKKAIQKIQSSQKLPSLLDRYRDKLAKRLEAQNAFFEALIDFQKSHKANQLTLVGSKYLQGKNFKVYESLVKKVGSGNPSGIKSADSSVEEQLLESFNDGIEPDPEEEFHRAIKRLNIEYKCSFEDGDDPGNN